MLVVLNDAPLELAGTIALEGQVLFEADQVARVRWVTMTRRIWLDERRRNGRSRAGKGARLAEQQSKWLL